MQLRAGDGHSVLDRVDVLVQVLSHLEAPRASALVESAIALLGFVIRDSRSVAALVPRLERAGSRFDETRRAAWIALGLLGCRELQWSADDALRSVDDVHAVALSITLARLDARLAKRALSRVIGASSIPPLVRRTGVALIARLHDGVLLGIRDRRDQSEAAP